MSATINIQFNNATFSQSNTTVSVGNGGSFVLASNQYLSLDGTFPFESLSVTSQMVSFYNIGGGASVNGQLSIPLDAANGSPTIEVSDFSGSAMVSWPSSEGMQYASLAPGDPLTLWQFAG